MKLKNATDVILENLLDAVLVVDDSGAIIYANRSAQQLFDKPLEELLGQGFGYPVKPAEVQEIEVIRKGELITAQMLASHIEWDGKRASLLSLRDISDQRKAFAALTASQVALQKVSEENADFASLASHDLKAPVRKILMFSDKLLLAPSLTKEHRKEVESIRKMALRMKSLIVGISDLSKVQHMEVQYVPVDLKAIVAEVCDDLEVQIEEANAKVEVADLPHIDAVQDDIYRLFANLISNSLKYSRKDTQPHINIFCEQVDENWIKINCRDNGIGFDNNEAKHLFEPFKRLHTTAYEGTGIGLSLCRKIVEKHGGQITAQGKPGQGALFSMLFPCRHSFTQTN